MVDTTATQISVPEFYRQIAQPNDLFLLDVRNQDEFDAWRIETRYTPETLHIPYFDFLEDEDGNMAKIPADREIVVVCAKGGSSDMIAEMMRARGMNAINLAGGMIDWGEYYHTHTVVEKETYSLYQVDRVARGCLSHILISNGEAVIIDPLRHIDYYQDFLKDKGATLKLLLDTHAHADHISGGPALAEETDAPYYLHPYDGIHPFDILPPKIDYEMMQDGQTFQVGDLTIKVVHTPGHTLGQVNFLVSAPDGEHYFFSGDTLFLDSFGRPDLGGQGETWVNIVYDTIFNVIKPAVPEGAYLFPGHYAKPSEANDDGIFMMTMGDLWQKNSSLQVGEKDEFVRFVLANLPHMPEQYIQIKRVNAGLVEPTEEEASELELGKNICALSGAYEDEA